MSLTQSLSPPSESKQQMGPEQEAFFSFFSLFWQQLLTKVAEAQLVVLTEVTGEPLVAEAVSPSDPCLQGGWVRS